MASPASTRLPRYFFSELMVNLAKSCSWRAFLPSREFTRNPCIIFIRTSAAVSLTSLS